MKRIVFAGVVGLAMFASACGSPSGSPSLDTTSTIPDRTTLSNVGGDGLPVQLPSESYGNASELLTGVLTLEPGGCWTVDLGDGPRIAMFPEGTTMHPVDGAVMVLPDGTEITDGFSFDGFGGVIPSGSLPGVPDGYWGNYLVYCDPERPEVVVLDEVAASFDASALTGPELLALATEADFSVSWPCGVGFAVSTEDQRVSLTVYHSDPTGGSFEPPVSLPDPNWEAWVTVGKNLMANNCDDVMEGWEPIPEQAIRWPITAGTLRFLPPDIDGCANQQVVTGTLEEADVETPSGALRLPDLSIANVAFGCFAG